jgi:putative ABC transport system permease protein
MKTRDLTELAWRNLREAILRNSLTTLGIAVGVASLVAMLSLGVGLQEMASTRLSKTGLFDAIIVMSQANQRAFGGPRRASSPAVPARRLDDEARQQLARIKNVVEVYPEVRFPTEIQFDGKPYATTVAGIPNSARADAAFDGMKGSFFSSPDADEAILQIELAKDLSKNQDSLIGQQIILRYAERQLLPSGEAAGQPQIPNAFGAPNKATAGKGDDAAGPGVEAHPASGFSVIPRELKLRIIGIVDTEPAAGFGGMGRGRLLIPLHVAQTLRITQPADLREMLRGTSDTPSYESLTVRVTSPKFVQGVEDEIKQMGFGTFSILDATKNLQLFFTVFDGLLGIFGSLALAVASLGIINTLVMAILERRREIGILKALGAADRDVRRLFFAEAGAMGLFGGIFGVLLGWMIGRAVTFGTNTYLARQQLPPIDLSSIPLWMVGAAIVFSFVVSLAAGMYPAARAAKLNPVEALRYE